MKDYNDTRYKPFLKQRKTIHTIIVEGYEKALEYYQNNRQTDCGQDELLEAWLQKLEDVHNYLNIDGDSDYPDEIWLDGDEEQIKDIEIFVDRKEG